MTAFAQRWRAELKPVGHKAARELEQAPRLPEPWQLLLRTRHRDGCSLP
jgi:hypothetical protein